MRPAVFLDRDGTIAEEVGYLNHASRFRMFLFVAAAVRRLNDAAAKRDGSRPKRIGGTKHRDDRQAYSSGNVHGARIIANEKMALG